MKEYTISSGRKKEPRPPRHLAKLSIWTGGLGILDIGTQLYYLKTKWIQMLINLTNAVSKDPILYSSNFFLNSNQGLALFRQKQIFRPNRHKNLQKQNNEDFFIQLLNAWLHFTNSNFPTRTSKVESLDQPIFLNLHPKLEFSADNPYFYCIQPRDISDKYTIIKDFYRFLQPGLTSSMTSDEKLRFPNANPKEHVNLL